jgi:hypothetical protein
MAACGLDCKGGELARPHEDTDAVQSVTGWFKEMGWLEDITKPQWSLTPALGWLLMEEGLL